MYFINYTSDHQSVTPILESCCFHIMTTKDSAIIIQFYCNSHKCYIHIKYNN